MIFCFLSCHEKAHDNKEFSCENSKPCRKSQIKTRKVEPCNLPEEMKKSLFMWLKENQSFF